MTMFVHARLGHFLQQELDDNGNDLGGSDNEEHEEEEQDENEDNQEEEQDENDNQDEEDESVVVTMGGKSLASDEDPELKAAPAWVKELRKSSKEKDRRIRELEAQVTKSSAPEAQQLPTLGKKPTMEDPDIDWDADKFEARLTKWHDDKRAIEQAEANQRKAVEQREKAWQASVQTYESAKTALKLRDFDEAEDTVKSTLDVTQQGIIIHAAENPAVVVYALGKNPKKAAELAAINDPVKFAFAVAKLETQLKVQSRKAPPPPERSISGTGRGTTGGDATLARLRAKAEETGDYGPVNDYRRAQKRKSRD